MKSNYTLRGLLDDGPVSREEALSRGIFDPSASGEIKRIRLGRKIPGQTPIYYLEEHDNEEVVRAYIEENEQILNGRSKGNITRLIGEREESLKDAWRSISEDYESKMENTHGNKQGYEECTCGKLVHAVNKAHHIATEH